MIFAQMLERVALSDLASVLCARKFSFALPGVDPKLLPFRFYLLLFYYLFIIIFEALRLVAAIFMFFFYLAAAERPQHCALVCIETYLMVFFWKTDVYSFEKSS